MAVTLHTNLGDLKLELFCEKCPRTCEVCSVDVDPVGCLF